MAHHTLRDLSAYFGAQMTAHGAVATLTAVAQTDLVKRLLGTYLRNKTPDQLRSMQDYVRGLGAGMQAAGVAGASIYHINATTIPNDDLRAMANAAIDHLFIKLGEDLSANLTRENAEQYVEEAISAANRARAINTTSTPVPPAALPGPTGAPMPTAPPAGTAPAAGTPTVVAAPSRHFVLETSAYTLGPEAAQAIASLNDVGFERWARLIRQLRDSDAGDPENEIPASQILLEGLKFPLAVDAAAAKAVLERNVPLEEDAREDLAVLTYFGLIDVYMTTDASFRARFEAAKDAFFTGKTKKMVMRTATMVGSGFILLYIIAIALMTGLLVIGAAVFVVGVVLYIQKSMTYVPALIASGGGIIILGCLPLAYIGWANRTLKEPFILAKATVLAMVEAFKHSISHNNDSEA